MLLQSVGVRALGRVGLRAFATKPTFKARLQTGLAQLDRLFLIGVTRFHEITGYTEIERIKAELAQLETDIETMRSRVREARELYSNRVMQRSNSQREMNELLMRKPAWTAPDLERFTQLYKADHQIQVDVEQAKRSYDEVESKLEDMQLETGKLIGARYREEQMFSDRIRQASTWGTWVLMGINIVLFVIVQLILEPWKRRRLVKSFETKVQQMFDDEKKAVANATPKSIAPVEFADTEQTEVNVEPEQPTWSNLLHRLQQPLLAVRPIEVGALALISTVAAGVVPVLMLAVSRR